MEPQDTISFKILILGNSQSGKISFIGRCVDDIFIENNIKNGKKYLQSREDDLKSTIPNFKNKEIIYENKGYLFNLSRLVEVRWGGGFQYSQQFRNTNIIFIIIDLCSNESISNIPQYISTSIRYMPSEEFPIYLIGCKVDNINNLITDDKLKRIEYFNTNYKQYPYFEVNNKNPDDNEKDQYFQIFKSLIIEKQLKDPSSSSSIPTSNNNNTTSTSTTKKGGFFKFWKK